MAILSNMYSIDSHTGAMVDFIIEDVNEIPIALETICNMYPYIYEGKKPEGFVFDEDRSVKWNREQVELFNKNLEADREKHRKLRCISKANLDEAVIDYILKYETSTNMSRAIAKGLLAKIKTEHDDCWWHWINSYVEFADFIIDSLEGETKKMLDTCEVCGKTEDCDVVCGCFGAYSYAICKDCLSSGKEPYRAMVSYIASVGRFPNDINSNYQALVREQLKLHNKTEEEFIKDVDNYINKMFTF